MMGYDLTDKDNLGIIPRLVFEIYNNIYIAPNHIKYFVRVSMMQIYKESIDDLIDTKKKNLKVRQSKELGIYVEGVSKEYADSANELMRLILKGNKNRKVGSHEMNNVSSRSHSIIQIIIEQVNMDNESKTQGKLFLVDLAGSERIKKTGANGERLEEAKFINLSLSTLGNVINSITDANSKFIP